MKKIAALLSLIVAGSALSWAIFRPPVSQAEESPEIILFSGENFTGNRLVLTNTVLDMPKGDEDGPEELRGWNDTVGSVIVVSGTWRLHQHGRLNTEIDKDETPEQVVLAEKAVVKGWACLVSALPDGPAEYATPASGGWESDVSSVELVSIQSLPAWAILSR
jgi:hypothetical protein